MVVRITGAQLAVSGGGVGGDCWVALAPSLKNYTFFFSNNKFLEIFQSSHYPVLKYIENDLLISVHSNIYICTVTLHYNVYFALSMLSVDRGIHQSVFTLVFYSFVTFLHGINDRCMMSDYDTCLCHEHIECIFSRLDQIFPVWVNLDS